MTADDCKMAVCTADSSMENARDYIYMKQAKNIICHNMKFHCNYPFTINNALPT